MDRPKCMRCGVYKVMHDDEQQGHPYVDASDPLWKVKLPVFVARSPKSWGLLIFLGSGGVVFALLAWLWQ